MAKTVVISHVKINTYTIIERAVEDGVSYGVMRAYKHTDNPSEEHLKTEIENAVMNSLSEVLVFSEE